MGLEARLWDQLGLLQLLEQQPPPEPLQILGSFPPDHLQLLHYLSQVLSLQLLSLLPRALQVWEGYNDVCMFLHSFMAWQLFSIVS